MANAARTGQKKRHASPFKALRILLSTKWDIHWSAVIDANSCRCMLVGRRKQNNEAVVLFNHVAAHKRCLFRWQRVVKTCVRDEPVFLVSDECAGESAERWIDRNESRIIPRGFTADQVITEWDKHGDTIFAATVTRVSLEKRRMLCQKRHLVPGSMTPPLWALARLYARCRSDDFLLWNIAATESVIGLVRGGYLRRLVTFWAGKRDLATGAIAIAEELKPLCKGLCGGEPISVIIVKGAHIRDCDNSLPYVQGFTYSEPPQIPGVAGEDHEVYALAIQEQTQVDYASIAETRAAAQVHASRALSLRIGKTAALAVCAASLLLGLFTGGLQLAETFVERRIAPVRAQIDQVNSRRAHADSLRTQFDLKTRDITGESIVTCLLSDFQTVFPDGVWAEQIGVSETSPTAWSVDLLAVSYSTANIPALLKNLGAIKGITDIRMMYSEQTAVKENRAEKKAVRVKVNCMWRM